MVKQAIPVLKWGELDEAARRRLIERAQPDWEALIAEVAPLVESVRREGDDAVRRLMARFDGADLPPSKWRVSRAAMESACEKLSPRLRQALEREAEALRRFHEAQRPPEMWLKTMAPGVIAGQAVRPLDSVGLYVPGGRAVYPTVMHALGIPAAVAGVGRVVACVPPHADRPILLAAACLAGVDELYRVGGVAAIAAMAYGTETIRPVEKIVGPGNLYVQAAKAIVQRRVAIDMLAGPSEVAVLADGGANPHWAAAELIAQAEHDPQAPCILVSDDAALIEAVAEAVPAQLADLPRRPIAEKALARHGALILTEGMEEALEVINAFAPEHLVVQVRDPWAVLPRIRNAGAVFLGDWTPVASGDYASGTNNTLPTGGWAKRVSGVSLETFLKRMEIESLTREGLVHLAEVIVPLAEAEGLGGHARSVILRLQTKEEVAG